MAVITPPIPSLISFLPDVVAVYNQNFIQVFRKARPLKVVVRPSSKLMEHPLETGATIIDHRVILPTEIELTLLLLRDDYYNTYQIIQQLFNDAAILTVQTKASVYKNQVIQDLPHEENPDYFNTFQIVLNLKEAQFAPPANNMVVPLDPTNNSTIDRGTQQLSPVPTNISLSNVNLGG